MSNGHKAIASTYGQEKRFIADNQKEKKQNPGHRLRAEKHER